MRACIYFCCAHPGTSSCSFPEKRHNFAGGGGGGGGGGYDLAVEMAIPSVGYKQTTCTLSILNIATSNGLNQGFFLLKCVFTSLST